MSVNDAYLTYWPGSYSRDGGAPITCPLAWAVSFEPAGLVNRLVVYVDATTGQPLSKEQGLGRRNPASETPD